MCFGQKKLQTLKRREFEKNRAQGRKVVRPEMLMVVNKVESPLKMGLVVSKKVGNAVVRNKVKRRLREMFRLLDCRRKQKPWNVVVVARKRAAQVGYKQLLDSFSLCLQQVERQV